MPDVWKFLAKNFTPVQQFVCISDSFRGTCTRADGQRPINRLESAVFGSNKPTKSVRTRSMSSAAPFENFAHESVGSVIGLREQLLRHYQPRAPPATKAVARAGQPRLCHGCERSTRLKHPWSPRNHLSAV